jgi:hypothetical protein
MTAGGISLAGIQTSPQIPVSTTTLPLPAPNASTPSTNETPAREQQTGSVDTVTIMNKVLDSKHETEKKDTQNDEKKQEKQPARSMNDVLFAYNFRGDLRIRFMDSVNKLVYQIPPVLVARMSDLMANPESSVNTKA